MKRFLGLLLLILLFSNTCAVVDVKTIAEKSADIRGATWDVDFAIPVITRNENMSDYFSIPAIAPPVADITMAWDAPLVVGLPHNNLFTFGLNIPASQIDLNGDGTYNDFNVKNIISTSQDGYIKITVSSDNDPINAGAPDDVDINTITMDGTVYNFGTPTGLGTNTVIFETTDFQNSVSSNHSLGGDGALNITVCNLELGVLKNTSNLTIKFEISFGSQYEVVGEIIGPINIYSITNQDVPFSTGLFGLKNFGITLEYNNKMPFAIAISGTFKSDQTPAGAAITDSSNNPVIAINQGEGSITLQTNNNEILKEDNVTVDFDIILPDSPPDYTISNNMILDAKLIITGTGTFNTGF